MKGYEDCLIHYMEGADKRFIIPVYQRNYNWKIENCKQLFDDLIKLKVSGRKHHFFGSIVSVNDAAGHLSDFLIIDGQQRLTTMTLLFLAMYDMLQARAISSNTPNLSEKILETYLLDKWKTGEDRIKLRPVKNDRIALNRLFDPSIENIMSSNLTINYQYFCGRIAAMPIQADELYDAITRLQIINIVLNHEDNPQLIFESLNSTGLDLNEGDKIRNYILMGLPGDQQERLYEQYWNRIEVCTDYDVSSFIRDYLSIKQQSTPAIRYVYIKFKDFVESKPFANNEELLKDLLAYAKLYETLLRANTNDDPLNGCIYRLNRLKTTVTRPFLMEVLRMHREEKIGREDLREIFFTCENYLFRRNICDLPTNALNKIFLLLHREVLRLNDDSAAYCNKFKYVLLGKKETGRFPDDEEFVEALSTKNIYAVKGESKIYLFERLENFNTLETKDIWAHLDKGDYSIEHIMPQHLNAEWMEALGEHYAQIHTVWLHRIANLTLTAYNSSYSNRPFLEKRDMQYGFRDSGLRMNQWISSHEQWTETELTERDKRIAEQALKIWPRPTTDYQAPKRQFDSVGLDDDVNLTGKDLLKYEFRGGEQAVSSWADMYQQVLTQLHSEDKSILTNLAASSDEKTDLSQHFATAGDASNFYRRIDQNVYVKTGINTQYKINVLKKIFELFGVEQSELVFYLKDEAPAGSDMPSELDIRWRYWSYALPLIREKCRSFQNVNPTKANWSNGYLGYTGIHICCVATNDSARCELYLEMEKEKNKALFDFLYSQKARIEELVKRSFIWNRSDENKSSKIFLTLSDVSVSKEQDWPVIANFHAQSSQLIRDVFSGLLEAYFRAEPQQAK